MLDRVRGGWAYLGDLTHLLFLGWGIVGNLTKLVIPRVGMFDKVAQEHGTYIVWL